MKILKKIATTVSAWAVALSLSLPILWMALTAFKTDLDALHLPPKIFFRPTLENFLAANGSVPVLRPILNSVVESSGATALCFLFAFPAAYALAFHGGRSRNTILLGMLMTRFMPGIGVMLPMYLIFKVIGLIDTRLGLVLVLALVNLPIVVWMLYCYMREIPRDILESARLDGATAVQQLVHVLFPLCLPGVCSTALLSVVLCWNESFWSIQMTSSTAAPLSAYIATLSGDVLWAKLSAASLLAVGPILLVGWLTQRTFVRGLTFGAVR
ncbi:carbohydrate ABC transporter permease [Lichenifustis flavocetrariae]|uniref:Carbohydrate ABC transporter permease n=1 Tax=Lichenifustis flavocetrariae TaxID=2949735 RepID=A0AA41Z4D5_9HYPH|nr:carbohydrate ABC transporter permease [Lichenifustis flavocetrariae]MCW6512718.1 carbohydrate ABC transporter permease [Lichenifustis flavocetrariae]